MNWNSIGRVAVAFMTYMALVSGYFLGLSPVGFALFSALVLCFALYIQYLDLSSVKSRLAVSNPRKQKVLPSLSESMTQLHALQTEINELQMQFKLDTELYHRPVSSNGSVS